jgi:hypothetical protein
VNYISVSLLLLLLLGGTAAGDPWGSADLAFRSSYLYRGVVFVDAPVLEPSVSVGASGFSSTLWGSMELTDENDYGEEYGTAEGEFTEIDLVIDYTRDLGPLWVYFGFGKYWYPNTGLESSSEAYASLGPNTVLSPSLNLFRDLEQSEGLYTSVSLSQSVSVCRVEPAITVNLGFGNRPHNRALYGVDKATVADLTFGLSVPWGVSPSVTITPSADFALLPDGEVADAFESSSNFRAGVSASWSFLP